MAFLAAFGFSSSSCLRLCGCLDHLRVFFRLLFDLVLLLLLSLLLLWRLIITFGDQCAFVTSGHLFELLILSCLWLVLLPCFRLLPLLVFLFPLLFFLFPVQWLFVLDVRSRSRLCFCFFVSSQSFIDHGLGYFEHCVGQLLGSLLSVHSDA